ncbi:MAG: D-2-hydroxyacid dehydrogenase [Treponema sp.]|nr:D-2-hydroxyacid dehydrogenase [Spirochaetales bacterium]MDY5810506.1 D-2-hydroxyacid dehydrogenase [Treponema sp.]
MKITVLDGNALNPGDLSWSSVERLGALTVYPRTSPEEVASRIGDSDAILLNKINITEEILSKCPNLKYIGVQATGYNVIDLEACRKHNVIVTNVPSYSTSGVAQMVFAYITEFASRTSVHNASVKNGDWVKCQDFCYWKVPLVELEGKTLGIYGYGSIGRRVAQIAKAFGMKVIVCTRTPKPDIENPVDFSTLLNDSDFITLHAPLTDKTREVINKTTLALMKKSAYLINTARGPLVNENDLAEALDKGTIAGYAADVVSEEPMKESNPLLKAKNTIITPHIAWAAVETRQRLINIVAQNLKCWIQGKPQNVVS